MSESPLKIGFNVPFSEAIKAAQQRNVVLPEVYYGELQGLARQQAFSIAGLASLDQLTIVKNSLAAKMQSGQTFRQWQKEITESGTLDLPKYRLDNIFRTNIQSNYNRGRWERFVAVKDTQPYLMYDAINDSRVRPSHLAMDGIIRPVDDQFWNTHAPLNGYRCRCRLISLNERQAQARSGNGTGLNKGVDASKMEPDKGFDYNPGEDLLAGINRGIASRATTAPAKLVKALDEKLAKEQSYWQAGTQQAHWHDASFANSPDFIKSVISRYDGLLKDVTSSTQKSAYYNNDRIEMGTALIDENYSNQGTWRHEYGHFIDNNITGRTERFRSSQADFTSQMKSDTDSIVENSGYGRRGKKTDSIRANNTANINLIRDNLSQLDDAGIKTYLSLKAEKIGISLDDIDSFFTKETCHTDNNLARMQRSAYLIEAISKRNAALFMDAINSMNYKDNSMTYNKGLVGKFSDLIGSATKNKLLGHGPHGNGGHSNSYYKQSSCFAPTEVFANLTALLGSDSVFWQKVTETFYPNLTSLFKDILK